jgi:hypothetical protein
VYGFEEQEEIVEQTVDRLLAAGRIVTPPVDPERIARALKINVLDRDLPMRRGQSYRYRGMKCVDIGKAGRAERRNFTLAHEIMELELPILVKRERHEAAIRGAAALLCPARFFREASKAEPLNLLNLKAIFRTASHEVIALRSLDFGEATISVFDNGRLVNRQTSYPFGIQPVAAEERALARTVMRSGNVEHAAWNGATATGYPVFEGDFRRVIVRTLLEAACD